VGERSGAIGHRVSLQADPSLAHLADPRGAFLSGDREDERRIAEKRADRT
jgi:hypothetical protein